MVTKRIETDTTHHESDVAAGARDPNKSFALLKGGTTPELTVEGDDTNTSVALNAKGTGKIVHKKRSIDLMDDFVDSTAGALTLTAAQILGGYIRRDPNGLARTDTLPTAALLVAAIPGAVVGQAFLFIYKNTADAAETVTIAAGTGGTLVGTATIVQNNSKIFLVRLTNVTAAAEAYDVFSVGTMVH